MEEAILSIPRSKDRVHTREIFIKEERPLMLGLISITL